MTRLSKEHIRSIVTALEQTARNLGLESGRDLSLFAVWAHFKLSASGHYDRSGERPFGDPDDVRRLWLASDVLRVGHDVVDRRWFAGSPRTVWDITRTLEHTPLQSASDHAVIFEEILANQRALKASGGEISSPPWVSQLMAAAAAAGRSLGRVYDPTCGFGGLLLEAHRAGATEVVGSDINSRAVAFARMRFELHEVAATIEQRSVLERLPEGDFDTVLMSPPFGLRLSPEERDRLPRAWAPGFRMDGVWPMMAITLAGRADGLAVVQLPRSAGFREGRDAETRRVLVDKKIIESVIALPSGAVYATSMPSALWVLRARRLPRQAGVLFAEVVPGDGQDERARGAAESANALVGALRGWREDPDVRRLKDAALPTAVASVADLHEAGYDLNPSRWVPQAESQAVERPRPPRRLLTQVRIGGFKSFGPVQEIDLAPITLLFGPNSSGKSSLLHALLLLKQSIGSTTLQAQGASVDLGGPLGLVHRHDRAGTVSLGLTYGAPWSTAASGTVVDPSELRRVSLEMPAAELEAGGRTVTLELFGEQFDLTGDASELRMPSADLLRLLEADAAAPRRWQEGAVRGASGRKSGLVSINRTLVQRARVVLRRAGHPEVLFPCSGLLPGVADLDLARFGTGSVVDDSRQAELAAGQVTALFDGVREEVGRLLSELVHLGPLRSPPTRYHSRDQGAGFGLGRSGERVPMFLYDNQSEVEAVNEWLGQLGVPYSLSVVPVNGGELSPAVGDLIAMILRDVRTGVDVTPADVGFGISQLLPIVVQCLAVRDSVIAIEQPEIHLHPRLQTELVDLFIETVREEGRGNQLIVETHSEHLMLRLQRRIREGLLDPEDLAIIYVDLDKDRGHAVASRLRLDGEGRFRDPWPHGFFDERFNEVFATRAPIYSEADEAGPLPHFEDPDPEEQGGPPP